MNVENFPFLQIHMGKYFRRPRARRGIKSIVFDLDETIGSFSDLHTLWMGLENIRTVPNENSQQSEFNAILDLYPEFLRYGILSIFDYLMTKKKQGIFDKIFLYTNNHCPPPWVSLLCNYIQSKMTPPHDSEVFDKVISAFKINKKVVEISRTTIQKTHSDFIRCSFLPATAEICFIDDSYHKNMLEDRVYYIQPAVYHHGLTREIIIRRFIQSDICKQILTIFTGGSPDDISALVGFFKDWFGGLPMNPVVYKNAEMDIMIAHKIMYHIKEFLFYSKRKHKTKKRGSGVSYHFSEFRKTRKVIP